MSDDPDGCEWVNVSSGTGLYPGSPGQKAVKRLCVCVCVCGFSVIFPNAGHFSLTAGVVAGLANVYHRCHYKFL